MLIIRALLLLLLVPFVSSYEWPGSDWEEISPEMVGMEPSKLTQARDYALTGGGSGIITRSGKAVMKWGDQNQRYDLKSTTKSFGATMLAIGIKDGKVALYDKAQSHFTNFGVPPDSNQDTGWLDDISLFHLATQTAGFEKPGGFEDLVFEPGTKWSYSDGGPNWLADCLTIEYNQDLNTVMFGRVFTPIGISSSDLTWRNNAYRSDTLNGVKRREFGSGISANVGAMARLGYLYLRDGSWDSLQILPQGYAELAGTPKAEVQGLPVLSTLNDQHAGASDHYGLLWWNNGDGAIPGVPTDTYWSWGLYDSWMIVIPSLDIVVARAGNTIPGDRTPSNYQIIEPFLKPIVGSVNAGSPYPNSPTISGIVWDDEVYRQAPGGDNWPTTWADDDNLYTAYGDGYGFEPLVPSKLSMGFARVEDDPPDHEGYNVRSSDETTGGGSSGQKASGILSIDGTLYMWVRNADQAGRTCELWWSDDHALNWEQSNWRLTDFGYCTFINFGKDYADSRDDYVYAVSHDNSSAYTRADQFILMRVHKDNIKNKGSYEYFSGTSSNPAWSSDVGDRTPVFYHEDKCFRSGISYNNGLDRYLWWQAKFDSGEDGRSVGKFGIFDAPEPWGPWTTVYYTLDWDIGAGETGHFPPKWMSNDGKTMFLVCSGNDYFTVRKAGLSNTSSATCPNSVCDPGETCAADNCCNGVSYETGTQVCCENTVHTGECCSGGDCSGLICHDHICVRCVLGSDCGSDPCTEYLCLNAGTASASCSESPITECINNDDCCPLGCDEASDSDCGTLVISNLQADSDNSYEIVYGGLNTGEEVYTDRAFTFTSIPGFLQSATYIKTANDDKASAGESFLTFNVNKPVTVYVGHDTRISPKPFWLQSFSLSGEEMDTTGALYTVFEKDMDGSVVLGGNEGVGNSMYSVVIVPTGVLCHAADTSNDNDIDMDELRVYIGLWNSGTVVIADLMEAIAYWKSGCP